MAPALFNMYSEALLNEALERMGGKKIGVQRINIITYADDQAILAESEDELAEIYR